MFLDQLLYFDLKRLFNNVSVFIIKSLWLHSYFILKEKWKKQNVSDNGLLKNMSLKLFAVCTSAPSLFTSLESSTSGLSLHRSSALIKPQHIIFYSNEVIRTTHGS
jgi:hypothetical protein